MAADSHEAHSATASQSSTPSVSRKSSTVRIKPKEHASNASLRQLQTPLPSDRTLTSFPSLSPSLENSPESRHKKDATAKPGNGSGASRTPFAKIPTALDGLFDPPSTVNERLALFEDSPKGIRDIPGALHLQSDEHIRHAVARTGAVALVRQLAGDLAQRDAQATLLQQRAEERERHLREILQECGLSKLDIDARLRELERKRNNQYDVLSLMSSKSSRRGSGASRANAPPAESINDRLSEAFDDSLEPEDAVPDGWASTLDEAHQATLRASLKRPSSVRDTQSLGPGTEPQHPPSQEYKGWKRYFGYSGKQSSNSESATGRRGSDNHATSSTSQAESTKSQAKPLTSDVFRPPPPVLIRSASSTASLQEQLRRTKSAEPRDAKSQKPTISVASWAMKLVAGTSQASGGTEQEQAKRSRASTVASGADEGSQTAVSATSKTRNGRRPEPLANVNGGMRKGTLSGLIPPMSPQTPSSAGDSNLGPVEMDTILPDETRPPTLLQQHNIGGSSEYLTDRFGFIYDQRRKKRQDEALAAVIRPEASANVQRVPNKRLSLGASNPKDEDAASFDSRTSQSKHESRPHTPVSVEEEKKPAKRWQDYLKISNITSTELLSHTPSAAPITSVTIADTIPEEAPTPPQVLMTKSGSATALSSNLTTLAVRTVSGNADIAQPVVSGTSSPVNGLANTHPDPVKSLLDQLTEVHDALQREKTVRWNEFLRKVRAERKREVEATAAQEGRSKSKAMPEASLADGEMIGISGLGVKGKVGRAKWSEFRSLVLGGIPVAFRAKIWAECSGAAGLRTPGYYDDLVTSQPNDPTTETQIQMDITRTLTDNIFFRKGPGVLKLKEVLLAYAKRNPDIGYCQGMNLITACLLLIMPTAEDAFWILVSMIENILPDKYYDSSLLTSRADQVVLRKYVAELLPQLSTHLEDLGIELEALTFQWFLSVFTDCLSAEALFRVWDVVLCINDGATFLFQVALALLKLNEKQLIACETPAEVYAYINHGVTDHAISIDGLVQASDGLKKVVRRDEVEKRRKAAVDRELEETLAREQIRKGKGRAVEETVPEPQVEQPSSGKGSAKTNSSSRDDEIEEEYGGELTARTPVPEEEEVLWRG